MANSKQFLNSKNKFIALIILLFIVISFVYFSPLLEGKSINAGDTNRASANSKEIRDYRENAGNDSQWTNNMFSGMPTYLVAARYPGNIISKIQNIYYKMPRPASYLILNFTLFFFLLLAFKVNIWVSFIGALAFGMNSAFFAWIEAGHMSKANTLTYIALVIIGIYLTYNKDILKGSVVAGLGLSFMLTANHPQITYYAALLVLIIVLTYFIYSIKEKTFPKFLKASVFLLLAAILAVGANFSRLATVYEYGKYSIRGKSELKAQDEDKTSGLDKSYILDYSYDLGEAMTAFIPRFKGGGMAEPLGENSEFYKQLEKTQGKQRAKQIAQQAPLYWGSQPISGAPFYYGAVLCFLFVFGLFMVKGKEKWWIIATVIISFLLSLGKYLPSLSHFMIDYFPGYNKFRDVKNIIVIQQFAMALMGVLAIKEVYHRKIDDKTFFKRLKWALGITGGLALIFALAPGLAGNFEGATDSRYLQAGWPQQWIDALKADRKSVLRADAFRSFIFVVLAATGLWAYWTKKLKAQYALAAWAILIIADMWPIDKRYLNNEDFISKRKAETPFTASAADLAILKDKSLDYRVLNISPSINPWSDASTSYFHKSIGGYHGAKMKRYQELIEHHLSPEMGRILFKLRSAKTVADLDTTLAGLNALNMLNTKYFIYNPQAAPLPNPYAFGNAWFANKYKLVANADEEIDQVNKVDVHSVAIVDQRFKNLLPAQISGDSTASIELTSYAPNKLVYTYSATKDQLAVFSEVYYPKGWVATVDGKEQPIFRTDYILRGMVVPAGEHEIIFEFKPKTYIVGNKVSFASSILLLLAVAGVVFVEINKKKKVTNAE